MGGMWTKPRGRRRPGRLLCIAVLTASRFCKKLHFHLGLLQGRVPVIHFHFPAYLCSQLSDLLFNLK